jgi:hypothetical protein
VNEASSDQRRSRPVSTTSPFDLGTAPITLHKESSQQHDEKLKIVLVSLQAPGRSNRAAAWQASRVKALRLDRTHVATVRLPWR